MLRPACVVPTRPPCSGSQLLTLLPNPHMPCSAPHSSSGSKKGRCWGPTEEPFLPVFSASSFSSLCLLSPLLVPPCFSFPSLSFSSFCVNRFCSNDQADLDPLAQVNPLVSLLSAGNCRNRAPDSLTCISAAQGSHGCKGKILRADFGVAEEEPRVLAG